MACPYAPNGLRETLGNLGPSNRSDWVKTHGRGTKLSDDLYGSRIHRPPAWAHVYHEWELVSICRQAKGGRWGGNIVRRGGLFSSYTCQCLGFRRGVVYAYDLAGNRKASNIRITPSADTPPAASSRRSPAPAWRKPRSPLRPAKGHCPTGPVSPPARRR